MRPKVFVFFWGFSKVTAPTEKLPSYRVATVVSKMPEPASQVVVANGNPQEQKLQECIRESQNTIDYV